MRGLRPHLLRNVRSLRSVAEVQRGRETAGVTERERPDVGEMPEQDAAHERLLSQLLTRNTVLTDQQRRERTMSKRREARPEESHYSHPLSLEWPAETLLHNSGEDYLGVGEDCLGMESPSDLTSDVEGPAGTRPAPSLTYRSNFGTKANSAVRNEAKDSHNKSDRETTSTIQSDRGTTSTNQSDRGTTHTNQSDRGTTHTNQLDRGTTYTNQSDRGTTSTNQSARGTTHTNQSDTDTSHLTPSKDNWNFSLDAKQQSPTSSGLSPTSSGLSFDSFDSMLPPGTSEPPNQLRQKTYISHKSLQSGDLKQRSNSKSRDNLRTGHLQRVSTHSFASETFSEGSAGRLSTGYPATSTLSSPGPGATLSSPSPTTTLSTPATSTTLSAPATGGTLSTPGPDQREDLMSLERLPQVEEEDDLTEMEKPVPGDSAPRKTRRPIANKLSRYDTAETERTPVSAESVALRIRREMVEEKTKAKEDSKGYRLVTNEMPDWSRRMSLQVETVLFKNIIYNSDGVVAINKPYGLPTHTLPWLQHSVEKYLPGLLKRLHKGKPVPESEKLFIIQTLPPNCSGVVLLARTPELARDLSSLVSSHRAVSTFWAITKGYPPHEDHALINIPLVELHCEGGYRIAPLPDHVNKRDAMSRRDAEFASTEYSVMSKANEAALLQCWPKSSVRNQIRSHLGLGLDCPILGDHKFSHFAKIAPQKLPELMLRRLKVRQAKVRDIPLHLHLRSVMFPSVLPGGFNLFVEARLPGWFKKNAELLQLNIKE